MEQAAPIKLELLLGHVVIDSRVRRDGNRLIGEGRRLDYDQRGVLRSDSGWTPTGVYCEVWDEWPDQPRRPWWRFW